MNSDRLKRKHEHLHTQVEQLEKIRESDRTAETKQKILELKKEKLAIKDELAVWERMANEAEN
tara:strand:- start:269 stop:457 length:189 start_codon:yes stop_codon:yes gene_type:complete